MSNRSFRLWVSRDPNGWDHEYASLKRPTLANGKTYVDHEQGGGMMDLYGNPLGIAKGRCVRVTCRVESKKGGAK